MKKNNGFTLIELLAVIVILAIVLIIAVPSIGNIIEKSKKDTFESSAKGIMEATKYFYSRNMSGTQTNYEFSFDDGKEGEATIGEQTYKLQFDGKAPTEGRVILSKDGKIDISICNDTYCACKPSNTTIVSVITRSEDGPCVLNEDGTVADNPVLSVQLQGLQDQIDELREDTDDNTSDINTINTNYLKDVYPVGSIYMSVSSANPGSGTDPMFPGTTWVAWGTGKVPVGVDTTQSEFNTVEKTGGEKTHTLLKSELPDYILDIMTAADGHPAATLYAGVGSASYVFGFTPTTVNGTNGYGQPWFAKSGGSNTPHNNLQPYITVYMWKRTN